MKTKSTKKPKRHVYILEPRTMKDGTKTYVLATGGAIVDWMPPRLNQAIPNAARLLDEYASWFGQHSELRVRRRDGSVGEARTYPRKSDPPRSKG